jgi:hypothetical protein
MRDQGQQLIAAALARARALQPGMRERDAADIIHALMSPELYRLLVIDRDWPPERYEKHIDPDRAPPRSGVSTQPAKFRESIMR